MFMNKIIETTKPYRPSAGLLVIRPQLALAGDECHISEIAPSIDQICKRINHGGSQCQTKEKERGKHCVIVEFA